MKKFILREVLFNDIKQELIDIGYDSSYRNNVSDKFRHKNIKIYDLSVPQANILKQTALSFGADCAVNKNVITGKAENSNVLLCGSYSQLNKICLKLKEQPFRLALLACEIQEFLLSASSKTKLAGILNITPDSFSDGGLYFKPEDAQAKLAELINDGADIIDIGAESTRPHSEPVEPEEQIKRLKPILNFIMKENIKIPFSVDTRSSITAEYALDNGAAIINDVSGLEDDPKMAEVISKYKSGVIIQHSKGKPEDTPVYKNVVEEVYLSLYNKIKTAKEAGLEKIIIDPGIGFGKSKADNLKLLDNIEVFYSLNCPVMVGLSRKRMLGEAGDNDLKDALTLAYSYPLIRSGVDYLRVHNVKLHKNLLNSLPE